MENNPNQIPNEILTAIQNAEIYTALEKIGGTYGLMLDQLGDLDVATRQLLIGNLKSSGYVPKIAEDLEISNQTAEKIAADVNTQIITPLKQLIRKNQEQGVPQNSIPMPVQMATPTPPVPTSAPQPLRPSPPPPRPSVALIEKAGDFTVMKPNQPTVPIYSEQKLSKEDVLADLENIKHLKPENAENFVEHLIENPAPIAQPRPIPPSPPPRLVNPPVQKAQPAPQPPPQQKNYSADPYREEI